MKKVLAIIAILAVLFCAPPEASSAHTEAIERGFDPDELYARVAIVSGFDFEQDLVFFTDLAGHVWGLYEIEDWIVGDIACLIFWDAGTPKIDDDECVWFTYNGRIDDMSKVLDGILLGVDYSLYPELYAE